jgi:hypothetical protein
MSFLRQLFGRRNTATTTEQKLARPNHKKIVISTDYAVGRQEEEVELEDNFFDYIIGYNDVKKFLRMSINTEEPGYFASPCIRG